MYAKPNNRRGKPPPVFIRENVALFKTEILCFDKEKNSVIKHCGIFFLAIIGS